MSGVVVFDYTSWAARYPEFSTIPATTVQAMFNEAQLYCDNTACSPVCDATPGGQRAMFLNMITAHLVALNFGVNGQPATPLVGRISNASEGSVSVGTQMDVPAGSAQWFAQTKYGIAFWQASAQYRMMRYVPGNAPISNPFTYRT